MQGVPFPAPQFALGFGAPAPPNGDVRDFPPLKAVAAAPYAAADRAAGAPNAMLVP